MNLQELSTLNLKDDSYIIYYDQMKPEGNNCIGYARVSTGMQVKDGFSLDTQKNSIAAKAFLKGLRLSCIYMEEGISGKDIKRRPALQHLLTNSKKGDTIIIPSVSRLARNAEEFLFMTRTLSEKGCNLIFLDIDIDTSTPSGKMMIGTLALFAEFERNLISERVKLVMENLKAQNKLRSKPAYGWMMNPDKSEGQPIHIPNPEEIKIIKEVKRLRRLRRDLSENAFTDYLHKRDIPTLRKSKYWHHSTVKKVLASDFS